MRNQRTRLRELKKLKSTAGRTLAFAAVAGAVSGYLLFEALRQGRPPHAPLSRPAEEGLEPGDLLPALPLLSLSGERFELRAPGGSRRMLLFVFSPTCSVCRDNLPPWRDLFRKARSSSIEVAGLSVMDPATTAAYAREQKLPWSVFCLDGERSFQALKLKRVPLTLLLAGTGRVALAFHGRLRSEQQRELVRALQAQSAVK